MENRHKYKVILEGGFVSEDILKQAISHLELNVTEISTAYSLTHYLDELPDAVPELAAACASALDGDYPDEWDSYHYIDKVIDSCDTDVVRDLARKVCKQISLHEDLFTVGELTVSLLMAGVNELKESED